MIRAKGTIIVDGKEYQKGQTVEGLSQADIRWMKSRGFIEEVKEKQETKRGAKAGNDISGDAKKGS